jgi:hypothetical protein
LPQRVTDHRDADAATLDVIDGTDQPPDSGRHAERLEEVARHPEAIHVLHFACRRQIEARIAKGNQRREGLLSRQQLLVLRQRDLPVATGVTAGAPVARQSHFDELMRGADRQRAQAQGVQQLEDRGVGANAQGERRDGGEGESRLLSQLAGRQA